MPSATPRRPKVPLSIVLQGKPGVSKSNIFLFPDGSGSGLAYGALPTIHPDACLIAMNSPFLADATRYTCSIEECTQLWVDELRQRQPHGPYILGGWSAGGYYAFEMAKSILAAGEAVAALILIDSPCRLVYEALPMPTVRELARNSLMGNWDAEAAPEWMLDHFQSTIAAIEKYQPTQAPAKAASKVYLIWARDGVLQDQNSDELNVDYSVKINRLLLQQRTDFTALGWDRLLPKTLMLAARMPGNHFQLVHSPFCESLSSLLRSAWTHQHGMNSEPVAENYESDTLM